MTQENVRCSWAVNDPISMLYHDVEWGVPLRDDLRLFELLNLEGAQAGLSWITILKRRDHYRRAFSNFDPEKIVKFNDKKIELLLNDAGIIRNRLKIMSVIQNAKVFLDMKDKNISFSDFLWGFVDDKPICNRHRSSKTIPAQTELSNQLSIALKKKGFKFVGSTICYAFMQASGMVNDHLVSCFRHAECKKIDK